MSRRTPLVAAVVGALVIGGATTGTTHALWHDDEDISPGSLQSGVMSNTVNGGESILGSVTLQPGGAGASVQTTITDTSLDGSKNLNQRFRVAGASFSSTTGLSDSELKLSVIPKPAGGCPTTPPTSAVAGYTSGVLGNTAPATPDQTLDICVTVAAASGALAGGTGTVTLQFVGEQVRPNGTVGGWSTSAHRTVEVTIAAPTVQLPGAPSAFSCSSFQNNNAVNLVWTAASGAVGYRIYRRQGIGPFSYALVKTATGTTAQVNRNGDFNPAVSSATLVVRAVNAAGESVDSNAIVVNFTASPQNCSQVTP